MNLEHLSRQMFLQVKLGDKPLFYFVIALYIELNRKPHCATI